MDNLKRYKVITAGSASLLSDLIEAYLIEGWQLLGGVSVTSSVSSLLYAQAIVK